MARRATTYYGQAIRMTPGMQGAILAHRTTWDARCACCGRELAASARTCGAGRRRARATASACCAYPASRRPDPGVGMERAREGQREQGRG